MKRQHAFTPIWLILILLSLTTCSEESSRVVTGTEANEIKRALEQRVFRQYDPYDVYADRRYAVVLIFDDGIGIAAQYSEKGVPINDWWVDSNDYRIEQTEDGNEIRFYFIEPFSGRFLPTECQDCIDTTGVSISVRDVFEKDMIEFKVNDPNKSLPSPFPIFTSWTRYIEDQPYY